MARLCFFLKKIENGGISLLSKAKRTKVSLARTFKMKYRNNVIAPYNTYSINLCRVAYTAPANFFSCVGNVRMYLRFAVTSLNMFNCSRCTVH